MWAACEGDAGAPPGADAGQEPAREGGAALYEDAGPDGICASCGGCEEVVSITSAQHKPEPISYPDPPPAGGDHASCWSRYGVHDEAVPEARWVHNLEHGAIVLLHNCGGDCDAEIAQLESLAEGRPFVLVTPDPRLPTRFAAVAWGVRLLSDCVDMEALGRFYKAHADQAPESITAGPPGGC